MLVKNTKQLRDYCRCQFLGHLTMPLSDSASPPDNSLPSERAWPLAKPSDSTSADGCTTLTAVACCRLLPGHQLLALAAFPQFAQCLLHTASTFTRNAHLTVDGVPCQFSLVHRVTGATQ
jgi:hypothetical protein